MTKDMRTVPGWRLFVRKHRLGSLFAALWVTTFFTLNTVLGWLWCLPLALLAIVALVLVLHEIVRSHRLEVRRMESAARNVRPRSGVRHHADGTEGSVRFIETGETGVFLAVDVDGQPVLLDAGESITVDVLGPGQAVTWNMKK